MMSEVGRSMLKLTPGMAPGAQANERWLEVPDIVLSTAEAVVDQLLDTPLFRDRYGDALSERDHEALRAWVEANLPPPNQPLLVPPSLDALRSWWTAQTERVSRPTGPIEESPKPASETAEASSPDAKIAAARRAIAEVRAAEVPPSHHGVLSGTSLDRVLAPIARVLHENFADAPVDARAEILAQALLEGVDPRALHDGLTSFPSHRVAQDHLESAFRRAGVAHAGPCAFRTLRELEARAAAEGRLVFGRFGALPLPASSDFGAVVTLEAIARAGDSLRGSELTPHLASAQLARMVCSQMGRGDAIDYGPLLAQFSTEDDLVHTLGLVLSRAGVSSPDAVARAFVRDEVATHLLSKRIIEPLRAQARARADESLAMLEALREAPGALDALLDGLAVDGLSPDRVRDMLGQLGIRAPGRLRLLVDLRAPVADLLAAPRAEQRETLLAWIADSRDQLVELRASLRNAMFQRDVANFLGRDADRILDLSDLGITTLDGPACNVAHALIQGELDARDPDEARGWVAFFTGAVIGFSTAGLGRALDVAVGGTVGGLPGYVEKLVEADRAEKQALLGLADASRASQIRSVALAELGVGIAAGGVADRLLAAVQRADDLLPAARRIAASARAYDAIMPVSLVGDSERDSALTPLVEAAARELAFAPAAAEASPQHRLGFAVASAVITTMQPKPSDMLRSLGLSDAERATVLTLYCANLGETLPALRARNPQAFPRRVAEDLRALCEGLRFIGGRSEALETEIL